MTRIKEEAVHYWFGTKLLWKETRISTRLIWKLLAGVKLTRREYNQVRHRNKRLTRVKAGAYRQGFVSSDSVCRLHHCTVYGTFASRRPQTVSQHAPE
jgi:hypothetical protein